MDIALNINLDLPTGWVFSGLWHDHYDKSGKPWSVDAEYVTGTEARPHTVISVEANGATPQEAFDALPQAIADAVKVITDTATWAQQHT